MEGQLVKSSTGVSHVLGKKPVVKGLLRLKCGLHVVAARAKRLKGDIHDQDLPCGRCLRMLAKEEGEE